MPKMPQHARMHQAILLGIDYERMKRQSNDLACSYSVQATWNLSGRYHSGREYYACLVLTSESKCDLY